MRPSILRHPAARPSLEWRREAGPLRRQQRIARIMLAGATAAAAAIGVLCGGVACTAEDDEQTVVQQLERAPTADAAEIDAALARAVDYLLASQNRDGSWGGPQWTGGVDGDPVPGAFGAFGAASTALVLEALLEVDVDGALSPPQRRAEEYVFQALEDVRRADPGNLPNVWAHAYSIQTVAELLRRTPEGDEPRRTRCIEFIRRQMRELARFETVNGGWFYYAGGLQRPDAPSCSFVNAAVLVALHRAQEQGVEPDERLTERALAMIRLSRKPDSSYLYSITTAFDRSGSMALINRPAGSLGRSQACHVAQRLWGDAQPSDDEIADWLERLILRQGWLDMGRKRPIPHESHAQVAGYFYYFGHYYAALALELLPAERRTSLSPRLARILIDRQEHDGSWFDYPLYNYHKAYGTAFSVLALDICRRTFETPMEGEERQRGPAASDRVRPAAD